MRAARRWPAEPTWVSAVSISRDIFGSSRRGRGTAGAAGAENFEDGGGFRDIFSQFFGGGTRPNSRPRRRGADLEYGLNVDFWQSIKGTQVKLNIIAPGDVRDMPRHGFGRAANVAVCPECDGSGTVTQMAGAMKFN